MPCAPCEELPMDYAELSIEQQCVVVCLAPLLPHFQPGLTSVALVCGAVAIIAAVWGTVHEGRLDY
jgi:hypothetical protein